MDKKTKYLYSVKLPNNSYKNINVTNATHLEDGYTYVTTTNKYPIMKFESNEGLLKDPVYMDVFPKTHIKFIGFIKNRPAIIPKNKWNIRVLSNKENGYKCVTIDSNENLKHKIVEAILDKHPKSCRCESCYQLIGFVHLHGFMIFVQLSCMHKPDHKLLYIIRTDLNSDSLECKNLQVTNEYNYYQMCLDHGSSEKDAKKCTFSGLYYYDNKVYLLSTNANKGYLWQMDYMANISYLARPQFIAKLKHQPKGIYADGSKLIVVCNNIRNKRMSYYVIKHIQ